MRNYCVRLLLLAGLIAGSGRSMHAQDVTRPEDASPDAVIKRGGKHWSSLTRVKLAEGAEMAAGTRFLVWPAEDREYSLRDDVIQVKLHWRLLPGQKPPAPIGSAKEGKDDLAAHLAYRGYDINMVSNRYGIWYSGLSDKRQLAIGANEGTIEAVFKLREGPVAVLFSPEKEPPGLLNYDPGTGLKGKGEMYLSLSPVELIPKKSHSNILKVAVRVDR
jgi:hypothetical protein